MFHYILIQRFCEQKKKSPICFMIGNLLIHKTVLIFLIKFNSLTSFQVSSVSVRSDV